MNRYIEILDDTHQLQQFTTDDLPFEINLFLEVEPSENIQPPISRILITKINNGVKDDITDEKENLEVYACAYIASDEDYLFFQPDTESNKKHSLKIFHNNEIIEKSVWLKSGDKIQINNKIIHYVVNGDIIKISVYDKPAAITTVDNDIILTPPVEKLNPPDTPHTDATDAELIAEAVQKKENQIVEKPPEKIKKGFIIFSAIILMIMLFFVLFSQTVKISIKPEPDKIHLSGILPAIKIAEQYLLISGDYQLRAEKKDYKTIIKNITIDSDNNKFEYVMQEKPGLITFDIIPDTDNTLIIDNNLIGEYVKQRQYEINSGEHIISVSNKKYKAFKKTIQVEGKNRQQQFIFKLQPNWGYVKISSETENVTLQIIADNNKNELLYNERLTDNNKLELLSGDYTLLVIKDRYKESIQKFTINTLQTTTIELSALEPEDAIIKLSSEPVGAYIRIDEKYMGKTPQTVIVAANEVHEIEVSLSGYKILKKQLLLQPEEISEQNYKLNELKGIIFISVSPAQAKLYIDGRQQKKTSGKFDIGGNNHVITVKARGYKTQTKKINAAQYSKNISFNLLPLNKTQSVKKVISGTGKGKKAVVKNRNYSNHIAQKMLLIKPASFVMGSRKNEAGRGSNEYEHRVKLDYSYFLSDKEVTNKQFRQFKAAHNSGMSSGQSLDRKEQPVVNISWNEAAEFANWLSKKEGLQPFYKKLNGNMLPVNLKARINGYRLPFEAEWSLAARGLNRQKYPWSGGFPPVIVSGNFADESARNYVANIIEGYNDKHGVAAPVGSYKKNAAGFYDLGGNVSEWCQDYYSPYSGFSTGKITLNPTGPEKGSHKVVRDSSWRDASKTELRLAYRSYSKKKAKDIGFRLARYTQ